MRTQETVQFDTLARETAATVRATVRRWWLDTKDRHVLHVEAERTFVGARPVVVHFAVPLGKTRQPIPTRQPKMEVGVPEAPKPRKTRTVRAKARPVARKSRPTTQKTRATARKARTITQKTRPAAQKTRPAAQKTRTAAQKARPARRTSTLQQQPRTQRQKRVGTVSKKSQRTSARR